jgi:uncharacterized membrane protein YcaP (DUF421 family)
MDKVNFITDIKEVEHAVIEHADGSFTSMPKSEYDKQQAEQSTPMVTDADKS